MKNKLAKGYSAIELMMAITIIALTLYFSINFSNSIIKLTPAQTASQEAYTYSKVVARYITTHQTLLRTLLSQNGATNGLVATVSPEVLIQESYIFNITFTKNNLNQTPCSIIYYDNRQLQSFVYYRDNSDSKILDQRQLNDGLNHMGAIMGIYQNGMVIGAAKDWLLESSVVQRLFLDQGTVDISQGNNKELYYCDGSQIAKNSYVVNVTSMLTLNDQLPNDDTIHRYQDVLHDVNDPQSNNQMNSDLNLDYVNPLTNKSIHSNIVFQNNPKCIMDPTKPATMYDYNPNNPQKSYNYSGDSTLGCKNLQLGFQESTDNTGNSIVTITGFEPGGISKSGVYDSRPYVGELSAASLQPTTKVLVGTSCTNSEVGKIAQQQKSNTANDVNNIYVSQVICMQSPTCPTSAAGYCYLPVQNVTIKYTPNTSSGQCPAGMFITNIQSNVQQFPDWGSHCCFSDPITGCHGNASAHNHYWEGYKVYKDSTLIASYINGALIDGGSMPAEPLALPQVTSTNLLFPNAVVMEPIDYGYTCDAICSCPGNPTWATQWQPLITAMTCTNDPSQAAIVIQQ